MHYQLTLDCYKYSYFLRTVPEWNILPPNIVSKATLEAHEFHVLSEHKPFTHNLNTKPDRHSPRQVHHLDFISQLTTDIRHIAGQGNPVADALSRFETNTIHTQS